MPHMLIIADDLTGAADTGAAFARAGWLTLVALDPAAPAPACDALVLSTESRDLTPEEAVAGVRAAVRQAVGEIPHVYKKIDSTLRGYPGLELAAVMAAMETQRALVAPAFPAQGRTTVGGQQLVDGVPVAQTAFGREVTVSHLPTLFQSPWRQRSAAPSQTGEVPVRHIDLSTLRRGPAAMDASLDVRTPGVVVADAETQADLTAIARAGLRSRVRVWCGSAGLAQALAAVLPQPEGERPAPGPIPYHAGPILVVAGSRHPRTARQVAVARECGAVIVRLEPGPPGAEPLAVEGTVAQAAAHLAEGRTVIVTTAGLSHSPLGDPALAHALARVTRRLITKSQVGGIVLTGGDVAAAVCVELEASALWLRGETRPGIPWGRLLGGLGPGLPVVTKAGGFGADDALAEAIARFEDWKAGGRKPDGIHQEHLLER